MQREEVLEAMDRRAGLQQVVAAPPAEVLVAARPVVGRAAAPEAAGLAALMVVKATVATAMAGMAAVDRATAMVMAITTTEVYPAIR